MIITVLALIFVFGVIVFSHELGHFIAAKLLGVKVETFAFGFPPRLWEKKIGQTTYALNVIPLGGYVNLKGEDEISEQSNVKPDSDSLWAKKPWEKIVIFAAGVVMNFILAVILLSICYMVGFAPIAPGMADFPGITTTQHVEIASVEKNAPADKQGIVSGDTIVSVDGKKTLTSNDVISAISAAASGGRNTVQVELLHQGNRESKSITRLPSATRA